MTQMTIYDFDDTLADQNCEAGGIITRLPKQGFDEFCEVLKINPSTSQNCVQLFKTYSDLQAFKILFENQSLNQFQKEFRAKMFEYLQSNGSGGNTSFCDFSSFFCDLRSKIILKVLEIHKENLKLTTLGAEVFSSQSIIYIITNSYEKVVSRHLELLGINTENIKILGTEEFLKTRLYGKPDSQVLALFFNENKILRPEKILYVGDSEVDRKFAQNCGINFQLFEKSRILEGREQQLSMR